MSSLDAVGLNERHVACLFADGSSAAGGTPGEVDLTSCSLYRLMKDKNPSCLRWWPACHRENFALQDLWTNAHPADVTEFLREVKLFLGWVETILEKSSPMHGEDIFFGNRIHESFQPTSCRVLLFAQSCWNPRRPVICNVVEHYGCWMRVCKNIVTDAAWQHLYDWLKQPLTYLRMMCLADVVFIFFRRLANQKKKPLEAGPADIEGKKDALCTALRRYGKTVDKAINHKKIDPSHSYIQFGLKNIQYDAKFSPMEIKGLIIDPIPGAPPLQMGFQSKDFHDVYKWFQSLSTALIANLDRRFEELQLWRGLHTLTQPDIWWHRHPPQKELGIISGHLGGKDRLKYLQNAWADMQPKVHSLLAKMQQVKEVQVPSREFVSKVLLPVLAQVADSELRTLIVVAAVTCWNDAQMDSDMETLRDLWSEHSKNLCVETLGSQMRTSLNHTERSRDKMSQPPEAQKILRSLANEIQALGKDSEQEHRPGKKGVRKRKCQDKGEIRLVRASWSRAPS